MNIRERRERILSALGRAGYLSVGELASELHVSEPTIRRDLVALERAGAIRRGHGGASPANPFVATRAFSQRHRANLPGKRRVATAAAGLATGATSIFIDSSSTTLCLAEALEPSGDVRILTNGLPIAQALGERDGARVEMTPGAFDPRHASLFGADAVDFVARRHADLVFVSASGIDAQAGVTSAVDVDGPLKRAFAANADTVVLLFDASKLGLVFYFTVFGISEADIVVVDGKAPEGLAAACAEAGTRLFETSM